MAVKRWLLFGLVYLELEKEMSQSELCRIKNEEVLFLRHSPDQLQTKMTASMGEVNAATF